MLIFLCPIALGENLLVYDTEISCINCQGVTAAGSTIYVASADNLTRYVHVGGDLEYDSHWSISGISPAIDSLGNVYLITGNSITKITAGSSTVIVSGLNSPLFLDIYNNQIYVTVSTTANLNNNMVKKYSLSGTFISDFINTLSEGYISGIRLDTQGNIYLSIYGGNSVSDPHISVYSPSGTQLRQLRIGQTEHGMFYVDQYNKIIYVNATWSALRKSSGTGTILTELSYPSFNFITNVAGSENKIYVADEGAEKVFIFDSINDYTYCGDGFLEFPEECDDGNTISNDGCENDCTLTFLPPELTGISGWHTVDNGWSVNEENRLVGAATTTDINMYSDPFDVRVDRDYILEAEILDSCPGVVVDLNDGKCLSRNGWTEQNCFADQQLSSTGQTTFFLTANNNNHISQGFLKNVSVRIHVPAGCTAKFDNIKFKEVSPLNPPHMGQPPINLTTACCPKEYCWDGSQCVLSDAWNISNTSNLWDTLTQIDDQLYKHVNTSRQWLAKGYRCTLNESGYADWVAAEIKYDWDFKESGYCIRDTDCFVSQTFGGVDLTTRQAFIESFNNGGSSCIKNGTFINDYYEINKGNHYCMNGTWTTKTFLIANVLENLTGGNPYILFCGNKDIIYNDLRGTGDQGAGNYIGGGCVLITKDGDAEKIITGVYSEDPALIGETDDLLCEFYKTHIASIEGSAPDCSSISDTVLTRNYNSCFGYNNDNTDFILCGTYENPGVQGISGKLYTYINIKDYYYLLSNERLTELENNWLYTLWNKIVGFFQRLFGYTPSQPLGLAAQTQNYEKLYVLSNNTLKVSAVEEQKYDESLVREMVYMYLNVTGSGMNDPNNKFNIEFVNKSMNGVYYTFDESETSRVLVIKYNAPAELWPYLTAMLRDRP